MLTIYLNNRPQAMKRELPEETSLEVRKLVLYVGLRPMFVALRVFGLWADLNSSFSFLNKLHVAYCILVLGLCFFSATHSFVMLVDMLSHVTDSFFTLLALTGWKMMSVWTVGWMHVVSRRQTKLKQFFAFWEMTCRSQTEKNQDITSLASLQKKVLFFAWILQIGIFTMLTACIFLTDRILLTLHYLPIGLVALKVYTVISIFYVAAGSVFPVILFFNICFILRLRFQQIAKYTEAQEELETPLCFTSRTGSSLRPDIEHMRQRHQSARELVTLADYIFRIYLLGMMAGYGMILCVSLYHLFWKCTNMLYRVLEATGAIIHLTFFLATTMIASSVNSSANQSQERIHKINMASLDNRTAIQILIFLNRLSSSNIGLTVGGLFVLTKSFLLTEMSIVVTYFLVLMQYRPPDHDDCKQNTLQ